MRASSDAAATRNSPASPPGVPTTPDSARPSTQQRRPFTSIAATFIQRSARGSPTCARMSSAVRVRRVDSHTAPSGASVARASTEGSRRVE
ncbi:MAG: hypothetical protein U0325_17075 [Polyangiales bacterium]